jgi:hypothetical protein
MVAIPAAPLAVIGGGVRMPPVQMASLQPVQPELAELPIERVASEVGENAFLPATVKPLPSPPVPVYPRKQARH